MRRTIRTSSLAAAALTLGALALLVSSASAPAATDGAGSLNAAHKCLVMTGSGDPATWSSTYTRRPGSDVSSQVTEPESGATASDTSRTGISIGSPVAAPDMPAFVNLKCNHRFPQIFTDTRRIQKTTR